MGTTGNQNRHHPMMQFGLRRTLLRKVTKTASKIRFKAKLCLPAESAKTRSWSFLILPKNASAKLPSRGMTAIEGTLNGYPSRPPSSQTAKKATGSKCTGS